MVQVAPATIGHSRSDTLDNLRFFFGDPVAPEKLRDYSEHHAMTYHFPDAYYGQNTSVSAHYEPHTPSSAPDPTPGSTPAPSPRRKIRETLNSLILQQPQEWQTSVALPFVKIEGTTVEWDELRFDMRLLQRVPVCS